MKSNNSLNNAYTRIGENGEPNTAGRYILFGTYPTSLVKDNATVSALNALAGELPVNGSNAAWTSYKYYIFDENDNDFMWYIDAAHEGMQYRGVYFTEYRPNDTMNTSEENRQEGNGYIEGRVYWFKYEPIKWKILDERDGKAWLLAENCIDSQAYREVVWENSYVKSSIRKWLNSDFINLAFNERERAAISRETVVNIMEDKDVCDGDKPGSDTFDFVHLLSEDEAADMLPVGKRKSLATDYALCQGIYAEKSNGNSMWWLRTPYYSVEAWACLVGTLDFCDFSTGEISSTETGVRPAIWLKV